MSHRKERSEKTWLNFNTQTIGRFCRVCGQENIASEKTFLKFIFFSFSVITVIVLFGLIVAVNALFNPAK